MHFYGTALLEINWRVYRLRHIMKVPAGTHPWLTHWVSFLTSQQALPIGSISAGPGGGSLWFQKPARLTRLGPKFSQRSRCDQ